MNTAIIGCGIAGLTAALELAERGISVELITKEVDPLESNSYHAQGGIVYVSREDSPELLVADIMTANGNTGDKAIAHLVATEGPVAVRELLIERYGVPFARDGHGELCFGGEAAHSTRRILYIKDATGEGIVRTLYAHAEKHPLISIRRRTMIAGIAVKGKRAVGVYTKEDDGDVAALPADAVILAAGGLGQIYAHTTNPRSATGDGFALALRAGALLRGMEYTQFHPTTMFDPRTNNALVSEAVRGEGARILAKNGDDFMPSYHPAASLAPRDIVSRAIALELVKRNEGYVLLDCRGISADMLRDRFPHIVEKALAAGVDITTTPLPVVPAFHFSCGGVAVDEHARTAVSGLYAVGEVSSTGLHGANRLASTSLLEGLTFGRRAAQDIAEQKFMRSTPAIAPWHDNGSRVPEADMITQDWTSIKNIMWNCVGIVRGRRRLARAVHDLTHVRAAMGRYYAGAKKNRSLLQLENALTTASAVASAANDNRVSAGCHYRID
ncbi:MAG: L-aspartate oxidase [Spirochaetota bacterium]